MTTGKRLSDQSKTLIGAISKGAGRPVGTVKYDPDDYLPDILNRLICGESMATICQDESMPSLRTVTSWTSGNDVIAQQVNDAKDVGVSMLIDACFEIARGNEDFSTGSIERDKLLTSVIKWIVEKREGKALRTYHANNIQITLSGDDANW